MSCLFSRQKNVASDSESILCRVGKSAAAAAALAGVTTLCATPDSLSTDEGIETAASCCHSPAPFASHVVRKVGYDVPSRHASFAREAAACRVSEEGQWTCDDDSALAPDSSPPLAPTYSHLFRSITSTTPSSGTCTSTCAHEQLHVSRDHDGAGDQGGCLPCCCRRCHRRGCHSCVCPSSSA